MKYLKKIIKRILSVFGLKLVRSKNMLVRFENFAHLASAYEQRLNEAYNIVILADDTRIKLLAQAQGTKPAEAYFIVQALVQCKDINGDVCEFGVAQGANSALIANEISHSGNKLLHLFDSFEGLPKPSQKDRLKDDIFSLGSMEAYTGTMSCPESMLQSRLKAISFPPERYFIHKGFIEQLIHTDKNLPKEVSFAYLDFDLYEPTKLTLEFLHRITPNGAFIIVDDYDFFSTGVKTAVDEWLEEKNFNKMIYDCSVPDTRYGHFIVLRKRS
jgi:O-methyltransferase